MPEVVSVSYEATTPEDLQSKLEEMKFEPVVDFEFDPPIRRVCDRAASDKSKLDQLVYGVVTDEEGRKEYCGVSVDDLRVSIVHRDFAKKRRDRYQKYPLPDDPKKRSDFVQNLIVETLDKWGSSRADAMGASYAHIALHVADFSNIEIDQARELVNQELPKMKYVERSVGDHWRIKPFIFSKSFRVGSPN